jgi:hypothetical protein
VIALHRLDSLFEEVVRPAEAATRKHKHATAAGLLSSLNAAYVLAQLEFQHVVGIEMMMKISCILSSHLLSHERDGHTRGTYRRINGLGFILQSKQIQVYSSFCCWVVHFEWLFPIAFGLQSNVWIRPPALSRVKADDWYSNAQAPGAINM